MNHSHNSIVCFFQRNINMEQGLLFSLIEKLFDLNQIKWSNIQIPTLINAILSFTTIKSYRSIIFEKILTFFNELRRNCSNEANT